MMCRTMVIAAIVPVPGFVRTVMNRRQRRIAREVANDRPRGFTLTKSEGGDHDEGKKFHHLPFDPALRIHFNIM